MDNIKDITKNTLFELKNKNLEMTPENYFIEFRNQAIKSNINVSELKLFDEIKNSLTKEEKNELNIESVIKLSAILSKRIVKEELKPLIEIFHDILSPSIHLDNTQDIQIFVNEILKNPKKLTHQNTISKLKEFTNQRIDADRKALKDKTDDIVKITTVMSKYFNKTLNDSDLSTKDIIKIKNDLTKLNILNSPVEELSDVQKKLINTINKMEDTIKESKQALSNNIENLQTLNKQVESLQKELVAAKEEKKVDFLTTLLNRQAYQEEAKKLEEQFLTSKTNFALIFIDLDRFKDINDAYGHACGDAILKNFASLLKDSTKQDDIVARYGGEEFILLKNYQNEMEIQRFIKEIQEILSNYIFVYNKQQIRITFSAGVTFRNKYLNFEVTQDIADKLLYRAKEQGRNKVFFDNGAEL